MKLNIVMGGVCFSVCSCVVRAFFRLIPHWVEAGMTGWPREVSQFHKL